MEVAQTQPQSGPAAARAPIVNDFSITVATVNGSGSQTANNTLIRAIHKMGVPVSGKNLFPSNIQACPPGSLSVSAKTATSPAASTPKF